MATKMAAVGERDAVLAFAAVGLTVMPVETPDEASGAVNKLARTAPEFALMEYYYRCRLIQDYISGMTDLYAWDEYRRLMAVE